MFGNSFKRSTLKFFILSDRGARDASSKAVAPIWSIQTPLAITRVKRTDNTFSIFPDGTRIIIAASAITGDTVHETIEPRQGVVFDVAFVQAERKFVNVAVEMLLAGVMIDAINAALHDCKNALDPVRGHAIADVFALAVIDRIVIEGQASNANIRASLVRVDVGRHRLQQRSGNSTGLCQIRH
jgi:hypothetical protein